MRPFANAASRMPFKARKCEKISAYDSTGLVPFVTLDVAKDIALDSENCAPTDGIENAGGEVTVNAAGVYCIQGEVTLTNTGVLKNRTRTEFWLMRDQGAGYAEVPGTRRGMYNRQLNQGHNSAAFSTILEVMPGEKFKLQAAVTFLPSSITPDASEIETVPNGSSLSLHSIG